MKQITVRVTAKAVAKKVWEVWSEPGHIVNWNTPSEDWHTPNAKNDLRVGGKFLSRMEARDGSLGFDFGGTYDEVVPQERIAYTLDDGRKVEVDFKELDGQTEIVSTFEAETQNTIELQRNGWQAILDSFKDYVETID